MINVKNIMLGIGIIVVFALTLWQGIEAFYPSPQYDDFCNSYNEVPARQVTTKPNFDYSQCIQSTELQEQQNQCYREEGFPVFDYDENGCEISVKECNLCNKEYESARDLYSQKVFIISLIIAIIILALGFTFLQTEPVGSALIGSSIWAIFYGTVINWRNFSNIWRFILLLIALILLIALALKLNKKEKKGFSKLFK